MTNNEKLFRLLGYEWQKVSTYGYPHKSEVYGTGWAWSNGETHLNEPKFISPNTPNPKCITLPDVSNFYELCRRWIIPEMRGKHICYEIKFNKFHWYFSGFNERPFKYLSAVEIIDDNIAAALVESAIEVLEGEK